ncbi:MAG TPA: BON domain-containing protein [Blastocatellia bacterium]
MRAEPSGVTLSGHVHARAERAGAERIAGTAYGVASINNRLPVFP